MLKFVRTICLVCAFAPYCSGIAQAAEPKQSKPKSVASEQAKSPASQSSTKQSSTKQPTANSSSSKPSTAGANDARSAKSTKPEEKKPLPATVIEVEGSVESAPAGTSVLASDGWKAVKVNDLLPPGTQIRTGLRSYVNLKFGETTVCSIRDATHASIDQLYRSATAEVVRMGLGYGTIRGGSTEGPVRSDLTVDSTVATLAKRGTEGWQIHVEPSTGRFNIALSDSGLVEAIQKLGNQRTASKTVRPGEYATDRTIANLWINQASFDRQVSFYDAGSVTVSESKAITDSNSGYGIMTPGGGSAVVDASARYNADWVIDQIDRNFPDGRPRPNTIVVQPDSRVIQRPEGNFGTGGIFRVLVPTSEQRARQAAFQPIRGRR